MFDNYRMVKQRMGSAVGLFDQFRMTLADLRARGCREILRRKHSPEYPSHKTMLDELLFRAGLDRKERRKVNHTVLGAVWSRKQLEEIAFVAPNDEFHERVYLGQESAKGDLDDLGVDLDYAEHLVRACKRYIESEYDFEERQETQMRELVAQAEGEMHAMRERLRECHEFTGKQLTRITDRLENLEGIVHIMLKEIVALAEGAQVPTKGVTGVAPAQKAKLDNTVSSLKSVPGQVKTQGMLGNTMKGILAHLSDLGPTSQARSHARSPKGSSHIGAMGAMSSMRSARSLPDLEEETVQESAAQFHRAHQRVSPHGRRTRVSAREEWRDK